MLIKFFEFFSFKEATVHIDGSHLAIRHGGMANFGLSPFVMAIAERGVLIEETSEY